MTLSYTIRPATSEDIQILVEHREAMFRAMGVQCDYAEMAIHYGKWLDEAMPSGTYWGCVAISTDGSVVAGGGVIVVPWSPGPWQMDPRNAWIVNVYTEPQHRGRGLARRLMNAMHDWCREQGIERTALNATSAGQRIYESMGYTLAHEPMMRYKVPT
ncbi:MAG: GNAT family N-acetyltransferase [Vicinamibacterales bacterium]